MKYGAHILIVLLALVCGSGRVCAQEVVTSEPQKLSSKTPNLRILGKNNEGIIIYKFGKGVDIVEAYNSNLMLKWSQNLSIKQENSSIDEIFLYPEYSLAFFKTQDKTNTVVFAQKLSSKFKGDGKFTVMDTLFHSSTDVNARMKIIHSQDKGHVAMYFPIVGSAGQLERLRVVGLNNELEVLYRQDLAFPDLSGDFGLVSVKAINNNQLVFLFENYNRNKKKFANEREYMVYQYDGNTGTISNVDFSFSKPIYGLLRMEVDNLNGQITVAGLYTDENRQESLGYFVESWNTESRRLTTQQYQGFNRELLHQVVGGDTTHPITGLSSFKPKELILRFDGGIVLVSESEYSNIESENMPTFMPSAGPSFRTVNVFYFNDILVVSTRPDGSLDWANVLRKKQVSEDDDGFFSSYSILAMDGQLRFVYNEEIFYKTNVNEYIVDSKGVSGRSFLFNAGTKELMLAPGIAKQISGRELLIPSFRNRSIKFVKITF
ncbi:hypothetical protein BH09BAC1_BH09BAC1_27320 [soil metagenome]